MTLDVQIRYLIRRDMPEVLAIERGCFEFPWNDEDFMGCLRQRQFIGIVAEHEHDIVGFMIYSLEKSRIHIANFGVKPVYQRCGVGRQMIDRLVDKLHAQRRHEIWTEVRERNVAAQSFFRAMRFAARNVLRNHFDDTDEDCYQFCFSLNDDELDAVYGRTVNRVWKFIERHRAGDDDHAELGGEGSVE